MEQIKSTATFRDLLELKQKKVKMYKCHGAYNPAFHPYTSMQ